MTGTTALAASSHSTVLRGAAAVLYGLLVAAWLVVALRTARDSARGRLFLPAPAPATAPAPAPAPASARESSAADSAAGLHIEQAEL